MPSPIAHVAVAYGVFSAVQHKLLVARQQGLKARGRVFLFVIICTMLPDIDVIPGLLLGDLRGIHNGVTNSFVVGAAVALLVSAVAWMSGSKRFGLWFVIALASYELHVLMDYFTADRGVMALWPLSSQRFIAPVLLFYGVHYTEGLFSIHHIWTVISELGFAAVVVGAVYLIPKLTSSLRRSPSG